MKKKDMHGHVPSEAQIEADLRQAQLWAQKNKVKKLKPGSLDQPVTYLFSGKHSQKGLL